MTPFFVFGVQYGKFEVSYNSATSNNIINSNQGGIINGGANTNGNFEKWFRDSGLGEIVGTDDTGKMQYTTQATENDTLYSKRDVGKTGTDGTRLAGEGDEPLRCTIR